jgi:hypothetical protein
MQRSRRNPLRLSDGSIPMGVAFSIRNLHPSVNQQVQPEPRFLEKLWKGRSCSARDATKPDLTCHSRAFHAAMGAGEPLKLGALFATVCGHGDRRCAVTRLSCPCRATALTMCVGPRIAGCPGFDLRTRRIVFSDDRDAYAEGGATVSGLGQRHRAPMACGDLADQGEPDAISPAGSGRAVRR